MTDLSLQQIIISAGLDSEQIIAYAGCVMELITEYATTVSKNIPVAYQDAAELMCLATVEGFD